MSHLYSHDEAADRSTLQALEDEIEKTLRENEAEHVALVRSLQFVKHYEANAQARACPWCGGSLLYIAPLRELEMGRCFDGTPFGEIVPNHWADWECQSCFVATSNRTTEPGSPRRGQEERWGRTNTPLKGGSIPVMLLKRYPRLKTIVKHSWGHSRDWYLGMENGMWYRFYGPGRKLLEWLPD